MNEPSPIIGQHWKGHGGIYAGIIRNPDNGQQWHLILASETATPPAIDKYEVAHCVFKGSWGQYPNEIAGKFSRNDGQHNTALILAAEPENNIAISISSLSIENHNDFYWPAECEQNLLFINVREHFIKSWHWSSTQYSALSAWVQYFADGYQFIYGKSSSYAARAVRRELII